jgi:hypothetical protein
VESRWPDLQAYEDENPDDGSGYFDMLSIARAYSITGNETRFNDAMARVRAAHDRSDEQGITVNYYLRTDAAYYALAGDRQMAISRLTQAVDNGLVLAVRFDNAWPALKVLAGDPDYEALQTRVFETMNAERKELGLKPRST